MSPTGRRTSSQEPGRICSQRRARTLSPDFLSRFSPPQRGWAMGRGRPTAVGGRAGARPVPRGRPEARWERPSMKCGPCPGRTAGLAWPCGARRPGPRGLHLARPSGAPALSRPVPPCPSLSCAPSVLSSSCLEQGPAGLGTWAQDRPHSAAPGRCRHAASLRSLSRPRGLWSELPGHSFPVPELSGWWTLSPKGPQGSVFPLLNFPKLNL